MRYNPPVGFRRERGMRVDITTIIIVVVCLVVGGGAAVMAYRR